MASLAKNEQSPVSDTYTLTRGSEEKDRLTKQHAYITEAISEGRLIYDKDVKLEEGSRVLDCATGTGSWILALAEEVGDKVELIGADISSAMFPSSYPSNVHFVEASVTKLPEEWTNTFDFINQRLLIAALTEPQWRVALSELYRVLKPGGALQLVDFRAHFPFGEGLQKTEELRQMSRALLEKRGQLPDCGNRLPQFALDAGFAEVKENIRNAPIGKSWGRIGEAGSENFRRVLHGFASAAMAEGGLGMYSSEDELHEVVEAASKEWESTDGLFFEFTIVTARKPL